MGVWDDICERVKADRCYKVIDLCVGVTGVI